MDCNCLALHIVAKCAIHAPATDLLGSKDEMEKVEKVITRVLDEPFSHKEDNLPPAKECGDNHNQSKSNINA